MSHVQLFSKICEVSEKSFYRWKSKDHKVLVELLEKYFEDGDIFEYLQTGKILRFELLPDIDQIEENISKKFKQKFKQILVEYDTSECDFKILSIISMMKHEKIELSQINILTFINESTKLSQLEKIAFIAAISDLSEFEFQVAINNDFIILI